MANKIKIGNEMQRQKDEIIDYFQKYIFEFIFSDMKRCIEAKANYTVALALLSYTEFLGGLIDGSLGVGGKSHERFNKALEFFYWNGDGNYYKKFEIRFKDIDSSEKGGDIYTLFRCGLAHEYFIKGDSLVSNNPLGYCDPNDKGIEIKTIEGQNRLFFNCNAYFRDFSNACIKYYKKLIIEEDKKLLKNFNDALDRVGVRKIIF